ncbi:MAG: LysR family transcriptional regulator [Sandaracinaceae bacterium]
MAMLRSLYRMGIFARVVEEGSFTAAAASLDLGKSVVSQHVRILEEELGVQLLNRNTRTLHMTDEGSRFYERCRRMLDAAEGALTDVAAARHEPQGVLKVTAPLNLGTSRLFVETVREYRRAYPSVDIELSLDDAVTDLIGHGFDVGLRVGWLSDSALFARRLAPFRLTLAASPAYLRDHGRPRRPPDLLKHCLIGLGVLTHPSRIELINRSGRRVTVKVPPKILTNTGIAGRQLALAGLGVGVLPDYAVLDDYASGDLVEVLPAWRMREGSISAVFAHRERLAPRTRLFVELLGARFHDDGST